MEPYEHLAVCPPDLIQALLTDPEEGAWMLDLETGDVLLAGIAALLGEEVEEAPFGDPDRYLPVPPLPASQGFALMRAFVEALPAGPAQAHLARALGDRHPFHAFHAALRAHPRDRERWFKYHEDRMLEIAQAWLDGHVPGARLEL